MSTHYLFLQEQPRLRHVLQLPIPYPLLPLPLPNLWLNWSQCQWIVNGKKESLLGAVHLEVFMLPPTGIYVWCTSYASYFTCSKVFSIVTLFLQGNWSFVCNEGSWNISWWPKICREYKAVTAGNSPEFIALLVPSIIICIVIKHIKL